MKASALLRTLHHVGMRLDNYCAWEATMNASPADREESFAITQRLREVIAFISQLVGNERYEAWIEEQTEAEIAATVARKQGLERSKAAPMEWYLKNGEWFQRRVFYEDD